MIKQHRSWRQQRHVLLLCSEFIRKKSSIAAMEVAFFYETSSRSSNCESRRGQRRNGTRTSVALEPEKESQKRRGVRWLIRKGGGGEQFVKWPQVTHQSTSHYFSHVPLLDSLCAFFSIHSPPLLLFVLSFLLASSALALFAAPTDTIPQITDSISI